MTYVIRSQLLNRVLAALLALAVGVGAAVLPARPADAGGGQRGLARGELVCFEIIKDGKIQVRCIHLIDLFPSPDLPPPPCPVCEALTFEFPDVLPDDRRILVLESLEEGFDLLAEAELAADPVAVDAFRGEAMERFRLAAGAATDPDIDPAMPVPVAGYLDVKSGAFEPAEVPAMTAAGIAIADGLTLLAATDPDVDPMIAAELFDKAFEQLSGAHYR